MQGGGGELYRGGRGKGKIDVMQNETDKLTDKDNAPTLVQYYTQYYTSFSEN